MKFTPARSYLAAAALVLSACNSGDGNAPPAAAGATPEQVASCVGSFAGNSTVSVTNVCTGGCGVNESRNAADGNRQTYASMMFKDNGGFATLRATAPSGVVFPGGNFAGAIINFPAVNGTSARSMFFRTWLAGVPQEIDLISGPDDVARGEDKRYGFNTVLPFDAVEVQITDNGNFDPEEIRVYEFCGR